MGLYLPKRPSRIYHIPRRNQRFIFGRAPGGRIPRRDFFQCRSPHHLAALKIIRGLLPITVPWAALPPPWWMAQSPAPPGLIGKKTCDPRKPAKPDGLVFFFSFSFPIHPSPLRAQWHLMNGANPVKMFPSMPAISPQSVCAPKWRGGERITECAPWPRSPDHYRAMDRQGLGVTSTEILLDPR